MKSTRKGNCHMNIKYEMWLTYNAEKEKIQLPVLPSSFEVKNGSQNDSVNLTNLGEITIMQSRSALEFRFSSFFPAAKFPGLQVSTLTKPLTLIQKINTWKASKTPIHFIVTACGIDIYVTIEDFNYSEQGGDVGTYQYSMTLKEYREISVRQVNTDIENQSAQVEKGETRIDNTVKPKTYTVKSGDCLWNIAKQYYQNGAEYQKIYEANKETIGGNPNLIYPGQVLTLP